ncbi:MAG: hypothetical protein H7123_02255 [Thermoleophilia bacterium]|nr:hypothetical protein [Thermoleophilia bacterium]
MFGVHIPELQLPDDAFRDAFRAAELKPGERYLELGSGHGRGLVIANVEFDAISHGVEYLPEAIQRSFDLATARGATVAIERADLMEVDPSDADVILLHLGAAFHDVLAPRLQGLLKPTTRVISCGWTVPGWLPTIASDAFDRGWIYQPSNPAWQCEWHDPHPADADAITHRTLPVEATVTEYVRLRAGTGLLQVGVTVTGDLENYLTVSVPCTELVRGQAMLVELTWTTPPELPPGTELTGGLQLHHALGDVGSPLPLRVMIAHDHVNDTTVHRISP